MSELPSTNTSATSYAKPAVRSTNFRYNISKTCVICGNLFIADMLNPTVEDTCSNCICSHCESNGELMDYSRDISSYELEQILNPCGYRTRAVMYE